MTNTESELKTFAVAAMISKYEINSGNVKSTTKLLNGWRYGLSKNEVLGSYTDFILTDFSSWSIESISVLEIEDGRDS